MANSDKNSRLLTSGGKNNTLPFLSNFDTSDQWDLETVLYRPSNRANKRVSTENRGLRFSLNVNEMR